MSITNKLRLNLPLVDTTEIHLEKNVEEVYTYLESKLNTFEKLEEIEQLGIVHYAMEVPVYNKWLYTKIVLNLIEIMSKTMNNTLKVPLALRNSKISIKGFLQAMILVEQLGHLPLTYTSEHALLRWIITSTKNWDPETDKIEDNVILRSIKQELENERFKEEEINAIVEQIKDQIYNQQDVFKFYRIISFLRVLQMLKHKKDELQKDIADLLKEISLVVLFDYNYPNSELWDIFSEKEMPTSEQLHKISKALNYFQIIKKLSFLVLDGSVSSTYATINPYSILHNIDRFLPRYDWEKTPHQKLLDDVEEFYANTLYRAPVTSYYHHFVVLRLYNLFEEKARTSENGNIYEILKVILTHDEELKQKVKDIIEELKKTNSKEYIPLRIPIKTTNLYRPLELELGLLEFISSRGDYSPEIIVGIRQTQSSGPYFLDIFLEKQEKYKIEDLTVILNVLNKTLDYADFTYGNFGEVLEFLLEHYLKAINGNVEIVKLGDPPLILRRPDNLDFGNGLNNSINSSESIELKCIEELVKRLWNPTEETTEKDFPLIVYRHIILRSPCRHGREQYGEHEYLINGIFEVNVGLSITSREYCYSEIDVIVIDLKSHLLYFGEVKTSKLKAEQIRRQFKVLLDKDLSKSQAERIIKQNTGQVESMHYKLIECPEKGKLLYFKIDST